MIRIGIIGFGYWGPNIFRNFSMITNATVVAVCDKNRDVFLKTISDSVRIETDPEKILCATDIDAIAIVTPVSTHYELARKALENGKHVFVEKPLTVNSSQSEDLIELAETKKLKIMVDHTFLFTGAVRKIKELIDSGEMGSIFYFDSIRVNLGLFQHDVNVVWDLAPHDFSILSFLIKEQPIAISAWGGSHVNIHKDIAYITIHFSTNIVAHISVNWLSPVKIRTMLIGGEKKMLVWNDLNADEKLKIYDRGVEVKGKQGIYDLLVSYRSGDMWAPKLEQIEALQLECGHFIDCIEKNTTPLNNGHHGLNVVQMLEACDESMKHDGKPVELQSGMKTVRDFYGDSNESEGLL